MRPKQINAKLCLALRRDTPTSNLQWHPVRGLAVRVPGWAALDLFTYRDGPVVFLVEKKTGLTLAFHSSRPRAIAKAIEQLTGKTTDQIREILDKELAEINPGPKPTMKLKL